MGKNYVAKVEGGGYKLAGSRVSLDSIVYDYCAGLAVQQIRQNFPTLSLEQIQGAIDYYLAHREEVDAQMARNRQKFESLREEWRPVSPLSKQKQSDKDKD